MIRKYKNLIVLVLLVLNFSFFVFNFAEAAECRLVNVITDKSQVGPEERIQVNVTAQRECIGQTVSLKICNLLECNDIAPQTFDSRTVNGQEAINSVVFFIVPTQFFNQNDSVVIQATVPFNTVRSQPIAVQVSAEQLLEDIFRSNIGENENQNDLGNENTLSGFPGEDLEANDVINIVIGLSCWLTRIAFTLAIIFVIVAGLRFVVAQGNQTKYSEAVTNFQHLLWGILVIFGVYVIIATVANAVGVTDFSFIPLVC